MLLPSNVVLAYLDPGTGSLMLQLLIAGVFSGMYFLKSSYGLIRDSVGRRFKNPA
jgi:hypothetical protein